MKSRACSTSHCTACTWLTWGRESVSSAQFCCVSAANEQIGVVAEAVAEMLRWVFAAVAVLAVPVFSIQHFKSHPHIRCGACRCIAQIIGAKMNESARIRTSIQVGGRLDENNKLKRIDYEKSELRAVEIMESTCAETEKYSLRHDATGARYFTNDTTPKAARFYGKEDKQSLKHAAKRLRTMCNEVLEEFDEHVVKTIQTERTLERVTHGMCVKGAAVCETAAQHKSRQREVDLFAEAEEREKAKEEAAARARQTQEEAEREAKERDAGFNWRQSTVHTDGAAEAPDLTRDDAAQTATATNGDPPQPEL